MSNIENIKNDLMYQIAQAVVRHFELMGHTLTTRVRDGNASEVMKFITINTDASVRMSVLKNARAHTPVHIKMETFVSAFEDESRAGIKTQRMIDIVPNDGKKLSEDELNSVVSQIANHITLKAENIRKPRTRYPVRDGLDKAVNSYCAGSFKVVKVDVTRDCEFDTIKEIVFHGKHGLKQSMGAKAAARITAPERMVGCRVVVHASGVVRILRETKFNTIYEIVEDKEV